MSPRIFNALTRAAAWMAACGLLALLLLSGVPRPADEALYDLNMRHWHYVPDNDVVIVAIDAGSLARMGRWPWPRSLHARLIDRLTSAGVRIIGMDISMATPDVGHLGDDLALAAAMRRNGHVVMPVAAEADGLGGTTEEALPIPPLSQAASALGHVGVALGSDGIARGVYLTAGLGQAYWPSLALALYQRDHPGNTYLPGLRNPAVATASPYRWIRDHYVRLRYAGPPGSFDRVSFDDVLAGQVPDALLKNRVALVGATAEGMGDILRTPVGPMPGVEYQANVFESLQRHQLITPLDFDAQFGIGIVLLAVPCLLAGLPGMRRVWHAVLAGAALVLLVSALLLRVGGYWWPPMACELALAIAWAAQALSARVHRRRSARGFSA